jgi:hypothetical protein
MSAATKSPTLTLRGRLAAAAELRTRLGASRSEPSTYVLQITLEPGAAGGLPMLAELAIGACSPLTWTCGSSRAKRMPRGTEVQIEATGFALERHGRGKARTEALRITGVSDITPTERATQAANDYHHQLDDRRFGAVA